MLEKKLSQSFSVSSFKKESEKFEYQNLSKSCIELIDLEDSEEIIPSSQGSAENDGNIKLSVLSAYEKSKCINNLNNDIKNVDQISLSVENQNEEIISQENKILNVKVMTSTPSKSKIPSLSDESKLCEASVMDTEHENNDKPQVPSISLKIIDEKLQSSVSEAGCIDSKIQGNSKDVIKDLNFLLDAVDNVVNNVPNETCHDIEIVFETEPPSDVEMKDISTQKEKTAVNISSDIQNEELQTKMNEPIAKRSRSNSKASQKVSSDSESYTLKLRKKNMDTKAKSQQKAKKQKNVNLNKQYMSKNKRIQPESKDYVKICDSEENTDESKIDKRVCLSPENAQPENENCVPFSDSEENKTKSEGSGQICSRPEKSKLDIEINQDKNCCFNVAVKPNVENSIILGNNAKTNDIESIENVESCEIFVGFSDSCKGTELNNDIDMISVDSNCILESNKEKNDPSNKDSQVVETCEMRDTDDVNAVTVIPCSLDDALVTTSKSIHETVSEKVDYDCNVTSVESFIVTSPAENAKINSDGCDIKTKLDSIPIEFNIIEDNVSCEMQNIVNSIISVCSQNDIDEDLSDKKLATNEQNVNCLEISDVETEKTNLPIEHGLKTQPQDIYESSQDSINLNNCDSSDVIISSHSESNLGNSADVLDSFNIVNVGSSIENEILDENKENVAGSKSVPDMLKKSPSENDSKSIPLELDHSYSISEDTSLLSDKNISNNIKMNKFTNLLVPCLEKEIDIKCNETKKEFFDEIVSGACSNPEREINLDVSRDIKTSEDSHQLKLNISNGETSKNELPSKELSNNSCENEVGYIIKELIVKVERLSNSQLIGQNLDSANAIMENYNNINNLSNSCKIADKENKILSGSDDLFAKGSKKRKIKPPIRSPFNFRQRTKMENSKKFQKGIKSLNVSHIKSVTENSDLVIKAIFPKDDSKNQENIDNSMAKIISSIVDSITNDDDEEEEEDVDKELHPDIPTSSQAPKGSRIELSNDELTDLNTRLNASIAPQTRRSKMIAASHESSEPENEPKHPNVVILCSENAPSKLSGILKKRKLSGPSPPSKARKVTFASPLIHEVVIENISEAEGIEVVTMNRIHSLAKRRNKILQEKNKKTIPRIPILSAGTVECDDVPSSSEYQDSDVLDFNELPVSPALINCPDNISNILKDLTSPSWIQGLESLLLSKNIKTIGDVCKLNIHQVKALPFKSPKVLTLHRALMAYINNTQEATLQKFKTIDDGSFETDDPSASSLGNSRKEGKTDIPEKNKTNSLEEAIMDVLKKERLKELPLNVIGQLIEACGKAVIEKK